MRVSALLPRSLTGQAVTQDSSSPGDNPGAVGCPQPPPSRWLHSTVRGQWAKHGVTKHRAGTGVQFGDHMRCWRAACLQVDMPEPATVLSYPHTPSPYPVPILESTAASRLCVTLSQSAGDVKAQSDCPGEHGSVH